MKKQILIAGVLASSLVSTNLFAQSQNEQVEKLDEIVVTATKFNLKKENSGKVITKITQKQLKNNAGKTVIEILNTVAGIDVRGVNANASEPRSINIRGGRSRQVLVLIDGVPVTDQSAINQEFDLRLLTLSQIESIEILKGASSTLYGSGAATAVINIVLKTASNDSVSGSFETSSGTNNTVNTSGSIFSDKNQNLSLNGTLGSLNYLGSFSITGVDGMSSSKSNSTSNFENDRYYSKNGLLKLGYKMNEKLSINTFLNYDEFEYDFDAGAFSDSDVNTGNQEQFRIGIKPKYNYKNGEVYLLASVNVVERNLQQFNSFSNTLDAYQFEGRSLNIDFVHQYEFSSKFQLITGLNYQEHSNHSTTPFATIDKERANFNTIDPYVSFVYVSNRGLSLNFGGRYNIHNVYGNEFVYDGNTAYNFRINDDNSIKVLASYSTAFIAPSLYQLYDGFSGNINLNPESNKTIEAGFEYRFKDWFSMDAVYFKRTETDAIVYDNSTYKYQNGSSNADGLEINSKISPSNILTLMTSYTYVNKNKLEDFNDYIPKHKLVSTLEVEPFKNLFFSLTYRNVGDRTIFDRYGSFGTAGSDVVLPKYQVIDFMTNYKLLKDTVTFFAAVTNILDEDYDDILGFSTRGRNYKIGVRLQF
ncbi:MAG: TonB-dependent receptor [Polaribacter sp.]|jgi:vitamin B12 transporter|nr:TonB-dependent receptor [Polaribacter sp.]MDG2356884.1 TonB-dependent receptor [Polaribacter sp.]